MVLIWMCFLRSPFKSIFFTCHIGHIGVKLSVTDMQTKTSPRND